MKVYLVNKHYDNGEKWDLNIEYDELLAIFDTKEKAETFINNVNSEYKKYYVTEIGKNDKGFLWRTDHYNTEFWEYYIKEMEVQ